MGMVNGISKGYWDTLRLAIVRSHYPSPTPSPNMKVSEEEMVIRGSVKFGTIKKSLLARTLILEGCWDFKKCGAKAGKEWRRDSCTLHCSSPIPLLGWALHTLKKKVVAFCKNLIWCLHINLMYRMAWPNIIKHIQKFRSWLGLGKSNPFNFEDHTMMNVLLVSGLKWVEKYFPALAISLESDQVFCLPELQDLLMLLLFLEENSRMFPKYFHKGYKL